MGSRGMELALVLVLVGSLWAGVMAQSGCTTAIIGLAPCLNYISGNSSTPASSCCSQLASVVSSQPKCLCLVLSGGISSFGININQTRALELPGACNVQTPPISQCNSGGAPTTSPVVESPAGSLAPSVAASPSLGPSPSLVPSISSGSGSKTTPSKGDLPSGGSVTELSIPMAFFLLFIASSASVLNSS